MQPSEGVVDRSLGFFIDTQPRIPDSPPSFPGLVGASAEQRLDAFQLAFVCRDDERGRASGREQPTSLRLAQPTLTSRGFSAVRGTKDTSLLAPAREV